MGIVRTKHIATSIILLLYSICLSQEAKLFICDDILISQEILISSNDTLEKIRISKIANHDGIIFTEQTISILFGGDSLLGQDYERNVNNGRPITRKISDTSIVYNTVSLEFANNLIESLFVNLLTNSQELFKSQPKKAKEYFDVLQKVILIMDIDKIKFLNEYCMYINLDLISLETHFMNAKFDRDERKMYFITMAYLMGEYDEISKMNFYLIHLELMDDNNFDSKLFAKRELKKLRKVLNRKTLIYWFKDTCWLGYL
ncbi:hypothetical protein N9F08_01220 [bacterium]|nr:hypothetical protein [bacterium]